MGLAGSFLLGRPLPLPAPLLKQVVSPCKSLSLMEPDWPDDFNGDTMGINGESLFSEHQKVKRNVVAMHFADVHGGLSHAKLHTEYTV